MKYLSSAQAAQKWGISSRRISGLAKEGRIEGAIQVGTRWMIPENAPRPIDGRTTEAKRKKPKADSFRFPIFEHRDLSSFSPPLTPEELVIKRTREAFFACRFHEADKCLSDLPERASDKYHRISALHGGCMIDVFLGNTERFYTRYGKLIAELQSDFPHKAELKEYVHEIDASLGDDKYFASEFRIDSNYNYHESFLPQLATLSAVSLTTASEKLTEESLRAHEMNCIYLEHTEAYVNLQAVHLYLGCAYTFLNQPSKMTAHFRAALTLAEKYELYYAPAIQYYYFRRAFKSALHGFSEEFKAHLQHVSDDIHRRYLRFTDQIALSSIYGMLSHQDYLLLYSAVQGYTNRETAKLLSVSEATIVKRYGHIYAQLDVENKTELISLYKRLASFSAKSKRSKAPKKCTPLSFISKSTSEPASS